MGKNFDFIKNNIEFGNNKTVIEYFDKANKDEIEEFKNAYQQGQWNLLYDKIRELNPTDWHLDDIARDIYSVIMENHMPINECVSCGSTNTELFEFNDNILVFCNDCRLKWYAAGEFEGFRENLNKEIFACWKKHVSAHYKKLDPNNLPNKWRA